MINHIKVNLNDYAAEEAPLTGISNKLIYNIVNTMRHPKIKTFKSFQLEKLRRLLHPPRRGRKY